MEIEDHRLWDSLFWNSPTTRPDQLAKILNDIFRRNTDGSHFIFHNQTFENTMSTNNLGRKPSVADSPSMFFMHNDKARFRQLNQLLRSMDQSNTKSGSSSNDKVETASSYTDHDFKETVTQVFPELYVDDGMVKPQPLQTHLLHLKKQSETFNNSKVLFSQKILLRMKAAIIELPLVCNTMEDDNLSINRSELEARVERLENMLDDLNQHVSIISDALDPYDMMAHFRMNYGNFTTIFIEFIPFVRI